MGVMLKAGILLFALYFYNFQMQKQIFFRSWENQKNKWDSDLNRVFNFLDTLAADFVGNWFVYYDDEDIIPYPLLGTAATYILNKLNIPTLLLKSHNGDTVCEGRCSEGFNIMDAFTHCKKYLKQLEVSLKQQVLRCNKKIMILSWIVLIISS
jgi:hypothetical protein